jgi:AcrR family transcriptional regulator
VARDVSGASPPRRGRPRGFNRDEALRQAMEVFWEKGYEGASLDDLQTAMGGISPPSFYAAFGSKEQLFLDVIRLYTETVGAAPMQALAGEPTARRAIEAMLRESVNVFCSAHTPRGCLLVLGAINCTPACRNIQEHMSGYRAQASEFIRLRLERGIADGDLPPGLDPAPLASFYAAMLMGLSIRARDGASRDELDRAIDCAMAAWDAYAGTAGGPPARR